LLLSLPARPRASAFQHFSFQLFSSEPLNLLFRQRLSAFQHFSFQLFSSAFSLFSFSAFQSFSFSLQPFPFSAFQHFSISAFSHKLPHLERILRHQHRQIRIHPIIAVAPHDLPVQEQIAAPPLRAFAAHAHRDEHLIGGKKNG
jgi:hypothetical protein